MKASVIYAIMAGAVLSATPASAEIINNPDHFYCAFSSEEDFNSWTAVDINGTNGSAENPDNLWVFNAENASAFMKCGSADGDDWLFSPKVKLTGGKSYIVKINLLADYPCRLQVTMGKDATPESQQNISDIQDLDGVHYQLYELPANVAAGDYCFGIHNTTTAESYGWLNIRSVEVVENNDGSIVFTLLNGKTNQPIEGVDLNLSGPTYLETAVKTDQSGKATFTSLTPGTYSVRYEILGLANTNPVEVTVGNSENVTHTLNALLLPPVTVSGTVTDHKGQACADASVTLKNDVNTYTTTTGTDGRFSIADVFGDIEYTMTISKFGKSDYQDKISLTAENKEIGSVQLEPYFGQPSGIAADAVESGMFVSWMVPLGHKEFSHDIGAYTGMYNRYGFDYVHYGVKFDEPMTVDEISWVVAELKDGKVDLAIYLLDKDGHMATTPVFTAKGVKSDTYAWTSYLNWQSYKLDEPVEAPYGCIVSVGHDSTTSGGMAMCSDYKECNTSLSGVNNLESGWSVVESYVGAFLLRAKGEVLSRNASVAQNAAAKYKVASTPKAMFAPATIEGVKFDVWRMSEENLENTDSWTRVASDVRNLYAIDTDFEKLPQGTYRYAVQTISDCGEKSGITISKPLAHKLSTNLTVSVFTNTAIELADGAAVTLKSEDGNTLFTSTVDNNKVIFNGIPKGVYNLIIEKYGYSTISEAIDLSSESSYEGTVELMLTPLAPFSMSAKQDENSYDVTLTWNQEEGIFDDFESMENFAINPAGDYGWTYADVDQGKTYGVNMCQQTPYPNMHSPMAFQAFNPSATTPDITEYIQPYSGQKVLVDVSQENAAQNDDYMFSPELSYDSPFILRFHAASGFFGLLGYEKFMVGYTTDEPKPENVIWITEEPVSASGTWTEYTYTMPAEARHTVIRCVSKDCMFFMLDDIFIGKVEADVFAMTSYKIEIDGEDAGATSSRSFKIKGLDSGKHIAKVQTVYTMADASKQYSDFTELIFNVAKPSAIDEIAAESLYSYDRQSRTLTAGQGATSMNVYDIHGRLVGSGNTINLDDKSYGVLIVAVTTADGRTVNNKIIP